MKKKSLLLILCAIFLCFASASAKEAGQIYLDAVNAAKNKNLDEAFMYYHSLLVSYPGSAHKEEALFATAEYYFIIRNYLGAKEAFLDFIDEYPESKAFPFAFAYLLRIARYNNNEALKKGIEKEIATLKQLSLLFRDFKELKYRCPLFREHRVIYYIDRVEFYIDGELFEKFSY